jgi:hypothetical protein
MLRSRGFEPGAHVTRDAGRVAGGSPKPVWPELIQAAFADTNDLRPTPYLRLYESVGMRAVQTRVIYEKPLAV